MKPLSLHLILSAWLAWSTALAQPVVNIVATDSEAAETWPGQPPNPGVVLLTRTGSTASALTVNLRLRGDAVLGRDFTVTGQPLATAQFAPGQSEVELIVSPIDDELSELTEEVRVELQDASEPKTAYLVGPKERARITIADNDDASRPPRAVVNVTPVDTGASEGADGHPVPIGFRVSRSANLAVPLTVSYTLSGTATAGADFEVPTGSVLLPAGIGSADILITPIDDSALESPETVILTLQPASCPGQFPPPPECYVVGDLSSATVLLQDNEVPPPLPVITLSVRQDTNVFGIHPAVIGTLRAVSPEGYLVSILLTMDGILQDSWKLDASSLPEPGSPLERPINLTNLSVERHELRASVTDNHGGTAQAVVALQLFALQPPEPPHVPTKYELFALDGEATETAAGEPAKPGRFLFVRTGTPGDLELFFYTFTGTAKQGIDYTITYGPVISGTNGPNEIRQEITIHPIDDLVIEGTETIKFELCFPIIAMIYGVGAPIGVTCTGDATYPNAYATMNLVDNDVQPAPYPIVTVAATDPDAQEVSPLAGDPPNPGVFTLTRTPPLSDPITVHYQLSRPSGAALPAVNTVAQDGIDYEHLSGSVTFPAGANQVGIAINPLFDTLLEGDETVTLTLSPSTEAAPTYLLDLGGQNNSASLRIHDYAPSTIPSVKLTVIDALAVEQLVSRREGRLLASRTGDLSNPLDVPYTLSGTAVNGVDYATLSGVASFASGAAQVPLSITPLRDGIFERYESVVVTLRPASTEAYPPAYLLARQASGGVTIRDTLSRRAYPKRFRTRHFAVPVPTHFVTTNTAEGISTTNAAPCWIIEASNDLVSWEEIGTSDSTSAAGAVDNFVDPDVEDRPRRFYRTRPCVPSQP